jgi:AAA15 family ATPase/GTPase
MLQYFAFQNFGSFREEAVLDMRATAYNGHEDFVLQMGKERVLPVAAIYGANASGKSTIIEAYKTMREFVHASIKMGSSNNNLLGSVQGVLIDHYNPFLLNGQSKTEPTMFKCAMLIEETCYTHMFSYDENGIVEEQLMTKSTKLHARTIELYAIRDGKFTTKHKELVKWCNLFEGLDRSSLFLTFLNSKNDQTAKKYCTAVYSSRPFDITDSCKNEDMLKYFSNIYAMDEGLEHFGNKILSAIDPCVLRMELIERETTDEDKKEKEYYAMMVHKVQDKEIRFPIKRESAGTTKVFSLGIALYLSLKRGNTCFFDELDARLHPMVIEYIISLFHNPETNEANGQLIFTTHNPVMLNHRKMRRDEIWFTEKNRAGESTLYSLTDIEGVRFDADYEKNYLQGNYGAIPFENCGDGDEQKNK